MNLAIFGINGFVGSAAAQYFLSKGHHVIGLVKDINRKTRPEIQKQCSIIQGDIRDKDAVQYLMSKYEVDHVLHLAAQPIVRICNNDPYTAYMTNVVGTLNVLEAARTLKKPPEKIIVMTSDKAYGPCETLPYKETTPLVVADTYCTSKACQDMVARSYAMTYDLPVMIVRAGNLYGPGDLNVSRLIPNSIIRLLLGQSPSLYSGVADNIREFIYIDNVIEAYEVLFKAGKHGEAYNVGGTEPKKVLDVIEMIRDKIDPFTKVGIIQKDFYEIKEQYLDSTKLQALGWSNRVDLSLGLDRTISWFRDGQGYGK